MKIIQFLICLSIYITSVSPAFAIREPQPLATDHRIKTINYHKDDVHKYIGFYGYQANIEFAEDEIIGNISMGDSTAWQIIPNGRRLFLKPIEADATTNMTLITNKRLYNFELHAFEAKDIYDERLTFTLRFSYPEEQTLNYAAYHSDKTFDLDTKHLEKYNFDYTISGDGSIAPIQIFDDNEFTYFKFKNKNANLPAFFIINSDGSEEMVNYRMMGDYLVIESVTSQFTLRSGDNILCVFNERLPLKLSSKKIRAKQSLF